MIDSNHTADTIQKLNHTDDVPAVDIYRHNGYIEALNSLREALNTNSSAILKGADGTGKTTLINELIEEYKQKDIPVILFNQPLARASQFFSQLAETLAVPKQQKELIHALHGTKEAGQVCLVVLDHEAINSSSDVIEALHQLCITSETTARSIRLIIVRNDYLSVHPEGTGESGFHKWIKNEITLPPLKIEDIEGYIGFLCNQEGITDCTPYEIGADKIMIGRTNGSIKQLHKMLIPLLRNEIISIDNVSIKSLNTQAAPSKHKIYPIIASIIVVIVFGIIYIVFSGNKPISDATINPDITTSPVQPQDETKPVPEQTEEIQTTQLEKQIELMPEEVKSQQVFQEEITKKVSALEQQLAEAVTENQKIKQELQKAAAEAENAQLAVSKQSAQIKENLAKGNQTIESEPDNSAPTIQESSKSVKAEISEAATSETTSKPAKEENSQTAPTVQQPLQIQASNLINQWIDAWQKQDYETYFTFYTTNFNGRYRTHQQWMKKRHDALTSPKWIKLSYDSITGLKRIGNKVQVDFWLNYEADNGYTDSTLKRLILIKSEGKWLIYKEKNLKIKHES